MKIDQEAGAPKLVHVVQDQLTTAWVSKEWAEWEQLRKSLEHEVIMKTAWGSDWGDNGYFNIPLINDNEGVCEMYLHSPTLYNF